MKLKVTWEYIIMSLAAVCMTAALAGLIYKIYQRMTPEETLENLIRLEVIVQEQQNTVFPWHDEENDIYYLFLPSYADVKQCYFDNSYKLKDFQIQDISYDDRKTLDEIELNQIYETTFTMKGAEQTIRMEFVQSAKLPTIYIDTASGTMDNIHKEKGNQESGDICILMPDGQLSFDGQLELIRARGNNTWFNDKKPYHIKLTKKADLFDMGEAKTWVLLAGAADGSVIRNKLVFDMAKDLGIKYAQDSQFVDLYLNGEYAGNYLLTEKIQINENRIAISDLGKATEEINGGEENLKKATPYLSEDENRWGFTDVRNPLDITGSYLMERDNYFEEEPSAFRLQSGEKFSLASPSYATKEEIDYIADTMQHIENAILAEDGIDPETGKDYKELIDFDGLVYKYLFDEVTKCDDGWRGSNYFYKQPDSIDSKVYCGPIWDYDLSLGNAPEWFVGDEKPEGVIQTRLSTWYAALWEKEEFRVAVIDTYNEIFKPYMLSMIADGGKIDQNVEVVQQSANVNLLRWQWKKEISLDLPTYEDQITFLKYFIQKRLEYLDKVWNEGVVYHEVLFTGVPKEYNRTEKYDYQYILDGELLVVPSEPTKENAEFIGWYYEGTEEELDCSRRITENVTIEAHWRELQTDSVSDKVEG